MVISTEQIHYEVADWALSGNKLPGIGRMPLNIIRSVLPAATYSRHWYRKIYNKDKSALFLQSNSSLCSNIKFCVVK